MNGSGLIDTALDRTLLGYTAVGLWGRRRLPDWPADPPRIDGRVVLVTGAASGLGLAACRGFARLGASVLAVARSEGRARDAVGQIRAAVPDADARPLGYDVASVAALRNLARSVERDHRRLDVLVLNAGVMPGRRERSAEGHELMFATHVLGPFALIAFTVEMLERSTARVIVVGSGGMYAERIPAEDLESERTSYGPKKLYARTKREQVAIVERWAERLKETGVVVHAMHPGWVDTSGVRTAMPVFRASLGSALRSPEQGADTILWLGASPQALESTGGFWHDRRRRPTHYLLGADEDSERDRETLWEYCESLIGGLER
jgi:dehydrogenase/reductase SDR family protein 12